MFEKKEKKEMFVTAVIEKLGAGNSYFLLGDMMPKEVVEAFVFKDWKNVFSSAHYAKDENAKKLAFTKLKEKAVTFTELAFVYVCGEDAEIAAHDLSRILEMATPMRWLELYAEIHYVGYAILERVDVIEKMAKHAIIMEVTKNHN